MKDIFDVIVIGGGASGLMAAAEAGRCKKRVLVLEKNSTLAAKLKISGGGRCNITNAEFDLKTLLHNYGKAEKLLYSPFLQFGVYDTFNFFTKHGLPLVVEANNRAFPKTQKAYDVYLTLYNILVKNHVSIKVDCEVKKLIKEGRNITKVETNMGTFLSKSVILSTGGVSHPETGSTGDGFNWLRELGHSVKDPTPSIVPLAAKDKWVKSIPGITLESVKINFYLNNKKQFSKEGPLLFTHFGVSGPTILNSASKVSDLLQEGSVTLTLDLYPKLDEKSLENRILEIFDLNKNKELKTIFKEIVPAGIAPGIKMLLSNINFDTKVHSIKKDDRKYIVHLLKALPIEITSLMGKDRAVAADGGIELSEVDMKTMRSKLIDNLYITGDLLNINRPSGGFSLQLCWTTGYIAGNNA